MDDPLATKTITLSCGKLTTGVTVKPWTGILMLRKLVQPGKRTFRRPSGCSRLGRSSTRTPVAQTRSRSSRRSATF
jgi:hypothetical protein